MNDLSPLERRVLDEALSQYLSMPVGSVKRSVAAKLLVRVSEPLRIVCKRPPFVVDDPIVIAGGA